MQCLGLPLASATMQEESPGSTGHPTSENRSSWQQLDMKEENNRLWPT